MRIDKLKIEGVGGIKSLDLSFNDRMNLLCGPNGIGKTTILESIAHIFSNGDTNILKRNVVNTNTRLHFPEFFLLSHMYHKNYF
jgi:predicted ATP-dependent endonuclease of OLD family